MASSSGASSASNSNGKASRFSTLKVFKFNAKEKPPPPPPKDPYYLPNKSLASLSPDSYSIPPQSPLSPNWPSQDPRGRSPAPSQSTMSLVSSAASSHSIPASAPKKKKSLGFLKFGKRAAKMKVLEDISPPPPPPPPEEDENISWPSNFSHNIHVDEGFAGLPPSWSKSLAHAGITEEEIAQINARRAANARAVQQYNARPDSPASYNPLSVSTSHPNHMYNLSASPVVTNPTPRSTSLMRQYSSASLDATSSLAHMPVPILSTSVSPPPMHHPSSSMSSDSHQVSRFNQSRPDNNTPPPAYTVPARGTPPETHPAGATSNSSPRPSIAHQSRPSAESTSSESSSSTHSTAHRGATQTQRAPVLPPRLSLHASNDSDDWSKLVLTATNRLGSVKDENENGGNERTPQGPKSTQGAKNQSTRTKPTIAVPDPESPTPKSSKSAGGSDSSKPPPSGWAEPATTARYPPHSPLSDNSSPSKDSPTWNEYKDELLDFVEKDDFKEAPYSAALTESFSPTLPDTRMRGRQRDTLRAAPDGKLLQPFGGDDDDDDLLSVRRPNRDSNRSSSSTLSTMSTSTITGLTSPQIVRQASIARRVGAYVTKVSVAPIGIREGSQLSTYPMERPPLSPMGSSFNAKPTSAPGSAGSRILPPSPMNSQFDSDESTSSNSASTSTWSQEHATPTTDTGVDVDLASYYVTSASPAKSTFHPHDYETSISSPRSPRDTFGMAPAKSISPIGENIAEDSFVDLDDENSEEEEKGSIWNGTGTSMRPVIVISDDPGIAQESPQSATGLSATPLTPLQRYPGWLSGVVSPLSDFIDESIEPREHYADLQEIAEGESGSIFAARLLPSNVHMLRLPPHVKKKDTVELAKGEPLLVAIKIIAIAPPSNNTSPEAQKLVDLERELKLMKGLSHENILSLDSLYVDLTEDTLWVRMELMERSLADIVGLVADGLVLQDRMVARFARDVLHALEFLQGHRIAHRDVRSDNMLLNSHGVLKLTDFSNAVRLPEGNSLRSDPAGVIFWQAPEMRYPNYDALKVDVWSVGATMWEMAETEPPFSDTKQVQSRWPPLTRPEMWSPAFHSFLRVCSETSATRKSPIELLKDPFVSNVCGRGVVVQLLAQCMNIERTIQDGDGGS